MIKEPSRSRIRFEKGHLHLVHGGSGRHVDDRRSTSIFGILRGRVAQGTTAIMRRIQGSKVSEKSKGDDCLIHKYRVGPLKGTTHLRAILAEF